MTTTGAQADRTLRVWLFVAALAGVGASLHLGLVAALPAVTASGSAVPWVVLATAFALGEVCVVHLQWGREAHTFGFGEIPLVLGLFFATPGNLISARLVGAGLALIVHRRQSPLKTAFNLVQWWVVTDVAILLWQLLRNVNEPRDVRTWGAAVVAALAADVLATITISAAITLRGMNVGLTMAWRALWTGALTAGANACFALVTVDVILIDWRGGWALLVVAGFLYIAQRAHVGLQRRHDSLERLNDFGSELSHRLDVEAVIDEVLRGSEVLLNAQDSELTLTPAFAGRPLVIRRTDGQVVRLEVQGEVVLPVVTCSANRLWRKQQVGVLTEHLLDNGTVIGALTVRGRLGEVGGFGSDDAQMLQSLVRHATSALANGRLTDRLRDQVRENEFQALHDALTELPNRVLFDRRVTQALAQDQELTVMLLDLDRFKEVNDTLGHAAGDQLLREAGVRIQGVAPEGSVVARLGGDEFALMLLGGSPEAARRCARDVREALLRPITMHGVTLSVDASVGISFAPTQGEDLQSLLRHADVAMYRAKQARSGVEVYVADDDEHSFSRLTLVSELREGLRTGQLELWYQPKIDISTNEVHSVEALVRWRHPVRGLVPPDEFISIAEQTGLIEPLTEWVLDEALRQSRVWSAQGLQVGVAVNISPRSLRRDAFPRDVRDCLTRHSVDPSLLTLEITESAMMEDPARAGARLRELRALGIRVSVDDFGTGYSSLSNLKNLPVDEVKIDKSFIQHLTEDAEDEAIVAAIVQLVHRLGMTVVAEGVETVEVLERLASIDCDIAQGYLISRPIDGPALGTWLLEHRQATVSAPGMHLVSPAA